MVAIIFSLTVESLCLVPVLLKEDAASIRKYLGRVVHCRTVVQIVHVVYTLWYMWYTQRKGFQDFIIENRFILIYLDIYMEICTLKNRFYRLRDRDEYYFRITLGSVLMFNKILKVINSCVWGRISNL